MALHPPQDTTKLIFAPAGSQPTGQAGQFLLSSLRRSDLHATSPIPQFHTWFSAAQQSHLVSHPEACTLSTAELPSGRVSARMVYLKELDADGGFVIYSNFGTSRKAADLRTNPHASLTFWWEPLQRQVRVEGLAKRISAAESQAYFDTRVRGSRIGAWASRQSQVLRPQEGASVETVDEDGREGKEEDDGRVRLEEWVKEREAQFEGAEKIPVPEFWGGLRIVPYRVEFWQGRENRLHDRFLYEREEGTGSEEWALERLSP